MKIARVTPKSFLGAQITNPKILASKIEEIIDAVNDLNDGDVTMVDLDLTGTLNVDGISTLGAATPLTISAAGVTQVKNTTDSTTKDTGSVILEGGMGIEKSIVTGSKITAGTTVQSGVGAVETPSFQVGAVDTGLYLLSATQTGFSQDGVLVATMDSDGLTANSFRNRILLGSTPVETVSIVEYGDGRDITTVLTLTNFIVGALAGAGAALGLGNIVYTFPAGQHFELVNSFSDIVLTAAGTTVSTDTGLGSVIASGPISALSGTGTFEDRLTGQTISAEAAGGAAVSALTAATAGIGTGISLNVAASVKNVFLNSAGTWNADNTGNLTATGTIVLKWTIM